MSTAPVLSSSLPVVCISDPHGCWFTMVRLLNTIPKPFQLVLLGDLIDRGPHSRQVVEFAMQHSIPTCAGNHEDLCLAYYRGKRAHCNVHYDPGVWLDNGGDKAVKGWPTIDKRSLKDWEVRQATGLGGRVPEEVLDWMESLPAYLLSAEDQVDENGRRCLFSHTGYGLEADKGHWFQALWGRHPHGDGDFPEDGYYRVFGHSPAKQAVVTDRWSLIDTGAAYGARGGAGLLTALLWPSKQLFSVPYDETPAKAAFTVTSGGCISS